MENRPIVMPRIIHKPNEYLLVAWVLLSLAIVAMVICGVVLSTEGLPMTSLFVQGGLAALSAPLCGFFFLFGTAKITVDQDGIAVGIGKWYWQRCEAAQVRTIVKCRDNSRFQRVFLYVSAMSSEELEALGQQSMGKMPFIRHELVFREKKADWKDCCLGEGLQCKADAIRLEYTPERAQMLQELFPRAVFREGKLANDPVSPA